MAFPFNSDAARGAILRKVFASALPEPEFVQPGDGVAPENIRRHRASKEMIGLVDQNLGT